MNNTGFEVERKKEDESEWKIISFIEGMINRNETTNYEYSDKGLSTGSYYYRLKQIDVNGNFKYFDLIEVVQIGIPDKFYVSHNYPNPFNPVTTINYNLPLAADLRITVYDNQGKLVKVLQDGYSPSGYFEINIEASELTSGLYYCNFEYANNTISRKMIVLK